VCACDRSIEFGFFVVASASFSAARLCCACGFCFFSKDVVCFGGFVCKGILFRQEASSTAEEFFLDIETISTAGLLRNSF